MRKHFAGAPSARAVPAPGGVRRTVSPTASRALALQRATGNRATARLLQRAIIAIDAKGESADNPKGRATRACLHNLMHVKGAKNFGKGDARGKVLGPGEIDTLNVPSHFLGSPTESLYMLGHGRRDEKSIAGLSPEEMADWLTFEFGATDFRGTLKLVACHAAADRTDRKADDPEGVYEFDTSYARELAWRLGRAPGLSMFRPTAVQGIVGVGWVDVFTGRLTSIDTDAYDRAVAHMTPTGSHSNPLTEEPNRVARGIMLRAWFGDPREAKVPMTTSERTTPAGEPLQSAMAVGKGRLGKRTFAVGGWAEERL